MTTQASMSHSVDSVDQTGTENYQNDPDIMAVDIERTAAHTKTRNSTFSGKRISDELDSDDELMMQMRENGFSDQQIAESLQREGRVCYDEKSISTRIVRIRHAKAQKVDYLLKEGYKQWEYEEDKLLLQAYALANIEINYEIERIQAWRFRKVSDYMRRLNKDALFSANACRERYNALIEGIARIPIKLDDDPEARRAEMEVYRIEREKTRRKEQVQKDLEEATKAKLQAEERSRKAQKVEECAKKRAQRAAEKAQRAAKRAEKAKMKEKAAAQAAKKTPCPATATPATVLTAPTTSTPTNSTPTTSTSPKKTKTKSTNRTATTNLSDPRTKLSLTDLKKLCKDRGIRLSSNKTKTALLQALRNADDKYSQKDLKSMCSAKGLAVTGTKPLLKHRLALAAARSCASFRKGNSVGARAGEQGKKGDDEMEDDGDDEDEDEDLMILEINGV